MSSKSEFDLNILAEVAARPLLWDSRMDSYKESEKKPAIWLEIAEKLQSTPAVVRARYENIRGSYRRYRTAMNKALALGKSGSGATVLKQPKTYKYAAEAAFLDAIFKLEATFESMDSDENTVTEVDDDLADSFISTGESSVQESECSGKKRKRTTDSDSDFNKVFMDAVQSITKLSGSIVKPGKKERDEGADEDWFFMNTMYLKLKEIPSGLDKDLCKMRFENEVMKLKYGVQNLECTQAVLTQENITEPQQKAQRRTIILRRPNPAPTTNIL